MRHILTVLSTVLVASVFAAEAQSAPIYSDTVLADNPLGYYRMNESSSASPAADSATNVITQGGVNNGVYFDGATANAGPTLGVTGPTYPTYPSGTKLPGLGATNTAATFDGLTGGSPQVGSDSLKVSSLTLGAAYTYEIWFRNTRNVTDRLITGYIGGRGTGGESVGIDGTVGVVGPGKIFFLSNNNVISVSATAISQDAWYYLAWTRSGTNVNVYLGDTSGNFSNIISTTSGGTGPSDSTIHAGVRPNQTWAFQGQLDELAVYNGALTSTQLQNHYLAALVVPEPASLGLMAMMGASLCVRRRRRS